LTRTRSRDKLLGGSTNLTVSTGLTRKKSSGPATFAVPSPPVAQDGVLTRKNSRGAAGFAMPSPGPVQSPGSRLTRKSSLSEFSRTGSLGSVDVGTLLGTADADVMQQMRQNSSLGIKRTRSQERLDQACMDLGFTKPADGGAGGPIRRMNSRGMQAVATANQEFENRRNKELSLDLFGLDMVMGPPSATTNDIKKAAMQRAAASPKPPKRPKTGDAPAGPSPRSKTQDKAAQAAAEASQMTAEGEDPWVNQNVKLKRGKYEGRVAFVLGRTEKKYQVQVEGVPYQLEFYSTMFVRPEDYKPPKGRKKKKIQEEFHGEDSTLGVELTPSLDVIPTGLEHLVSPGGRVVRTRSQEKMSVLMGGGLQF